MPATPIVVGLVVLALLITGVSLRAWITRRAKDR